MKSRWHFSAHVAVAVTAGLVLTSCLPQGASSAAALDDAEDAARDRAQEYVIATGGILQRSRDASMAENALDGNSTLFGSRSSGDRVSWDLVVVGVGFSGGGVGTFTEGVRGCIRLTGSPGSADVQVTDTECPPGPEHDYGLPSYSETRKLYD